MGLIDKLKILIERKPVRVIFNGQSYDFGLEEFPGLTGRGRIIVNNSPYLQESKTEGNFRGLNVNQENYDVYVNGVDLRGLIDARYHQAPPMLKQK